MSLKVLIVDDSTMVRQQVKRALVGRGFEVIEAVDGIDALEKANESPDITLIVADVNMPRMDGLEFLATLRQDPRFATVPTIMLTTEAQPELVARAKSLHAKGWIIKPFKPELFTSAIQKLALAG